MSSRGAPLISAMGRPTACARSEAGCSSIGPPCRCCSGRSRLGAARRSSTFVRAAPDPGCRSARSCSAACSAQCPVVLTDLYPHWQNGVYAGASNDSRDALPVQQFIFVPFPVDATQVSPALPGFRTLFTAFHHFDPPAAQAILQSAVDQRQGIGIFEQTQRSFLGLLVMLVLPLLAWLFTPFLRPFRWPRFFWTYIIPAIPAVLLHDGLVSCLRTYEPYELRALVEPLHGTSYTWEIGRACSPLSPLGITYLVGWPTTADPVTPGAPAQSKRTTPQIDI